MALEKVKVLEVELSKQEEYFAIQEKNYQATIEQLKSELIKARLKNESRDEQMNEIVTMAGDFKRQNRVLKNEQVLARKQIADGDERLLKLQLENQRLLTKSQRQQSGANALSQANLIALDANQGLP